MGNVEFATMENTQNQPAKEGSIFRNRCPKCGQTPIFKGFYSMNAKCSNCGNVYEKESGYFMGAMMAGYFLGVISVIPTLIICLFALQLELPTALMIAGGQLLLLQPILFRYSRLIWINIEHKLSRKA